MNTRPTSGKVRESLFNQLAHGGLEAGFEGLRVLDLFAGSGALGLEALSRGAASVVMVDADGAALAAMERNIEALRYQDRVRIVRGRLPQALNRLIGSSFDLIFCDPPMVPSMPSPSSRRSPRLAWSLRVPRWCGKMELSMRLRSGAGNAGSPSGAWRYRDDRLAAFA